MSGFMLRGLLTGAATAVTQKVKADDEAAKEMATVQTRNLLTRYNSVKEKNDELANKLKANVQTVKGYFPNLNEDQLFEAAKNPAFMDGIAQVKKDRNFDPTSIDTNALIKLTGEVTGKTAYQRINSLIDNSISAVPAPEPKEGLGFFEARSARAAKQQFDKNAALVGVSPDMLRGVMTYKAPELTGEADFNLGALYKGSQSFAEQKDTALRAALAAQQKGDEVGITKAKEDLSRFAIIEDMAGNANKSEAQIQSNLINKIQEAKDPKDKTILTAELRQRQVLSKLPGEGQEKVSQSNLITVASKAVTSAVSDRLPPGSFIITQNQDGTTSLAPKDIESAKQFKEAMAAGRTAVIKEMTGPDGKPKDQLHRNALISIGVGFDDNGRAVAPSSAPPAPPPKPAAPAASTPEAKPATTAQPTTAKPLPFTADGSADKAKLVKGQAYEDNGVIKTWTGIGWK